MHQICNIAVYIHKIQQNQSTIIRGMRYTTDEEEWERKAENNMYPYLHDLLPYLHVLWTEYS